MKVLAFSDTHGNVEAVRNVARNASSFDVVLGAGDFGLASVEPELKKIDAPMILVPGNGESHDDLLSADLNPNTVVLHGSTAFLNGTEFFGLGGGIPTTPFGDWSFDLTEREAAHELEACPEGAMMVLHSPPLGHCDVNRGGRHLGSTAIYAAMVHKKPLAAVCGHIHASAGQRSSLSVGGPMVYNAGPNGVAFTI